MKQDPYKIVSEAITNEGLYYRNERLLLIPGVIPGRNILKGIGMSLQGASLVIDNKFKKVMCTLALVTRNDKKRFVWKANFSDLKGVSLSKLRLSFTTKDGKTTSFIIPITARNATKRFLKNHNIIKYGKDKTSDSTKEINWMNKYPNRI